MARIRVRGALLLGVAGRRACSVLLLALAALVVGCAETPPPAAPHPPAPPAPAKAPVAPPAPDPPAFLDPAILHGTLPNGLQYYVLRREEPAGRAAVWLAVNAGSVLEDADQRGLAHFVEHLAFAGTTHSPRRFARRRSKCSGASTRIGIVRT